MTRPTKQSRRRRGRDRRKEFETRWRLGEFVNKWQAVLGRVSGEGYRVHLHKPAARFSGMDTTVCGRESRVHRLRTNPFDGEQNTADRGYGVHGVCKACVTIAMHRLDIAAARRLG